MKLIAQIAAGIVLGVIVVCFLAALLLDSNNSGHSRDNSVAPTISSNDSPSPASAPPYEITLCSAGSNGHCYSSTPMGSAFGSMGECMAALPAFAGHTASEDGRAYVDHTMWYECIGQSPETSFLPAPASPQPIPAQNYAAFICKSDQPACEQITQPMDLTDETCIQDILAAGDPGYVVVNDRVYAGNERDAWYECRPFRFGSPVYP